MAKTMGLRQEASFAKNDGSCETRGVTTLLFPKQASITTIAYGDQIAAHRQTLVIATLAMRTSALSAFAS